MKLKNTLGVVIGSLVAASAMNAFAQGQNSVEIEAFGKRYFTDSVRNMKNADLYGGSIGYFLTDDVELALSYGEYHDVRGTYETGNKKVHGNLTSLDAIYHFGTPGVGLRPYVSAGLAHQNITNINSDSQGRQQMTMANIGAGLKYYFTENFFAKASLDGQYGLEKRDNGHQGEWMAAWASASTSVVRKPLRLRNRLPTFAPTPTTTAFATTSTSARIPRPTSPLTPTAARLSPKSYAYSWT